MDAMSRSRSQSHGSGDPEDSNMESAVNDVATDYENDSLPTNGEDVRLLVCSPDDQSAEISNDRAFVDGGNSETTPVRQNLLDRSTVRGTAEPDTVTRREPVDGNNEHLPPPMYLPNEDFDDERDPNYATQRPDTLGAINAVAASAIPSTFAANRPVYHMPAASRAWPLEDGAFAGNGTSHLGRRTCGAGMDQVELNQRQLKEDDIDDEIGGSDDGGNDSEFCDEDDDDDGDDEDAGLCSANQCESTEADQYKMDPEADQTAGMAENVPMGHRAAELRETGVLSTDARLGMRGSVPGTRHRTDGALVGITHDLEDPEEDQAVSSATSDIHPSVMSAPKVPDAANLMPDNEQQHGALRQHPQSAFSIPKPRVAKNRCREFDAAGFSQRPVPSVRQSKSNTELVFKPISMCVGKPDPPVPKPLAASKGGPHTVHGEVCCQLPADTRQQSAGDSGISSQDKKEADTDVEFGHAHPSKLERDASVGRSAWARELVWNIADQPVVVYNDPHTLCSISFPAACHLPGEGGAISVGSFAPANSSSEQATPQKVSRRVLSDSLDMSPIHPISTSSSRPLSANGLLPVDAVSANDIFPSSDFYAGTQLLYPYKVRVSFCRVINFMGVYIVNLLLVLFSGCLHCRDLMIVFRIMDFV